MTWTLTSLALTLWSIFLFDLDYLFELFCWLIFQKYYFLCNWYQFHSLWWLCNRVAITFQRIPSSCFEVSETSVKYSVATLAYMWNNGIQRIQSLAQGEDWRNFFKVGNWMHWRFHEVENCICLWPYTWEPESFWTYFLHLHSFFPSCNTTHFPSLSPIEKKYSWQANPIQLWGHHLLVLTIILLLEFSFSSFLAFDWGLNFFSRTLCM